MNQPGQQTERRDHDQHQDGDIGKQSVGYGFPETDKEPDISQRDTRQPDQAGYFFGIRFP